ncbi:cytochrome P450 [Streptomyces sp. NPDC048337]|uniref:cytochrome P450 n=1 Tax=Streptomyces sp. NPDC048337 TaxID=3365535 RepID=UPI003716E97A
MTAPPLRAVAGPAGLPVLNCLPSFRRDPLGFMTGLSDNAGDSVTVSLAQKRCLFIFHPAHIAELLAAKERTFGIQQPGWAFRRAAGQSVLLSTGAEWRRKRALVQPVVRPRRTRANAPVMVDCAQALADTWRDGMRIDVYAHMVLLTRRVLLRTLFGDDIRGAMGGLDEALATAERIVGAEIRSLGQFLPGWVPAPGRIGLRRAVSVIDAEVGRLIRNRQAAGGTHQREDLLCRLLEARDHCGRPLSAQEVRDEAVTLLVTGQATVATALTWCWHLLSGHPHAVELLEAELVQVLAGRAPSVDDYQDLIVTRQILREALRLYPPLWLSLAVAQDGAVLGNAAIPAGTTVLHSPWITQRDPRWFSDPAEFRPERWHPHRHDPLGDRAWLPFGSGARACLGAHFAQTMAVLLLATLAQRFRLDVLEAPRGLYTGLLLQPDPPLTATVRDRRTSARRSPGDGSLCGPPDDRRGTAHFTHATP